MCVAPSRPKLTDRETGEVKVDREGRTVYQVGLSVANAEGRIDLVTVNVSGEPEVQVGQIVTLSDLIALRSRLGVSNRLASDLLHKIRTTQTA